ncbi:MAG TPA: isoprenyl transferase [Alphaproteobacteria bacterium]|nr:isoprenyl transferase [Alphaproteobacteria bacterium]
MDPVTSPSPPPAQPIHVAIVMDGNGRWAKARGLPRVAGHRRGVEAVRQAARNAIDLGVSYLTLFGFSSENWRRPPQEIDDLMGLLRIYLRGEVAELHKNGVRLRIIGDRARLGPDIVELIESAEAITRANTALNLTVALSYGGRQDIVQAAQRVAADAKAGRVAPEAIDEDLLARYLWTAELPDPDLVIRTSGERRLSNFLLWQSAYAEFVYLDTLWPDFSKSDFEDAIRQYHGRERRYGTSRG